MQTRTQSILEVLVDFACSMLINIGGQLLFYHTVATVGRVTLFAALVLGLAFARRLATRRFFEALVDIPTRNLKSRDNSEKQPGRKRRQKREHESSSINAHSLQKRNADRPRRRECACR